MIGAVKSPPDFPAPASVAAAPSHVSSNAAEVEGRHIAGLLAYVERESHVSQRALAGELGVALGLVNSYIKRCVKKGLIKVQQVPSRRYAYFLTPTGFAEKSRLTAEYLSWSFSFFRQARTQCSELFEAAAGRKWQKVALFGGSDLTEIAVLCAAEQGMTIVAIVDAGMRKPNLLGIPVVAALELAPSSPDCAIVTGIHNAEACYELAIGHFGANRVLVPAMLSIRSRASQS